MPEATHRAELPLGRTPPEVLAARLWASGALGVWERPEDLVAWFPAPRDLTASEDPPELRDALSAARWSVEEDRDWQEEWKATIGPVRAGRIVVVPTWLATDHRAEDGDAIIVLDPGRAFGSGHHATTLLCLEMLDELDATSGLEGCSVADVGCGSGILGIAAAARGARVVAVDIDPAAVATTRENADRNHVRVDVRPGSVEALDGPADVLVANLLTDVIAGLAADLVGAVRTTLIASGITAERQEVALRALTIAGLEVDRIRERDGWIVVVGHRASSGTA